MAEDIKQPKYRSAEECAGAADMAVHFSFKTVNSNIPGGGIRLSKSDGLFLPFISGRTLIAAGYNLDYEYTTNNGILNAVLAIASGENQLTDLSPREASEIRAVVAEQVDLMKDGHEANTDTLDPRMRQLLIPDQSQAHGYACISPLTSVSVCKLVHTACVAHNERQKELSKNGEHLPNRVIPFATMGFGGAKFMNVGRLTTHLKSVPVFVGPKRNVAIRAAMAIHYKGIELKLPELVMAKMAAWAYETQQKNEGRLPINMQTREQVSQFAADITRYIGKQVATATRQLNTNAKHLPSSRERSIPPVGSDISPTIAGLFDRSLRSASWHADLAAELCAAVISFVGETESGIEWQIELQPELESMLTKLIVKELPL